MAKAFARGLSSDFINKLRAEAKKPGWWADVLADPELFIGVRDEYLDVYWLGQRLFHITAGLSGLNVTIHPKYLLDPSLEEPVEFRNGNFDIRELKEIGFIGQYEAKDTLKKLKKAAGYFSGLEKTGCHRIALQNPQVIDCEIAFAGQGRLGPGPEPGPDFTEEAAALLDATRSRPPRRRATRADMASLEMYGEDARLVFWEAKLYSNGELRAAGGRPRVCNQIEGYSRHLTENRDSIETSYKNVTKNLNEIREMGWKRTLSDLIIDVAKSNRHLTLGPHPHVGLLIFGFDDGQRKEDSWRKKHLPKLQDEIGKKLVRAIGDVRQLRLPP